MAFYVMSCHVMSCHLMHVRHAVHVMYMAATIWVPSVLFIIGASGLGKVFFVLLELSKLPL